MSFNGIVADTCTTDSATQVTATWPDGVPLASNSSGISAKLHFKTTLATSNETHFAVNDVLTKNELLVHTSTTGASCSFAGGCTFEVTAGAGLKTMLKSAQVKADNRITICDKTCLPQLNASTEAKIVCQVPPIATVYSNE